MDQEQPRPRQRRRHREEKATLLRWLHPQGHTWGLAMGDFDPSLVERCLDRLGPFFGPGRYFRLSVDGLDRVPESPVMVVSNHSGGTTIPDAWGLAYAWYRHFGTQRPIHPAAHEMVLGNRVTGPFFSKIGVVRADRNVAKRILSERGEDMLVMPGGDLDVWRPFTARYEVRFAGRTGYARLALEAGVPIIPVANVGAHASLIVLTDGRKLAEALRFPELVRAHIFPIHLSLPWGLAIGPWPHIPLPVHLRYRFGDPIYPADVGVTPGSEPTDAQVLALDARVRAGVQAQLDALRPA